MRGYASIDIPFVTGQDQSADGKVVPSGTLTRAENILFEKVGRTVLRPTLQPLTQGSGYIPGRSSVVTTLPGGVILARPVEDDSSVPLFVNDSGAVTIGPGRASALRAVLSVNHNVTISEGSQASSVDFNDTYIVVVFDKAFTVYRKDTGAFVANRQLPLVEFDESNELVLIKPFMHSSGAGMSVLRIKNYFTAGNVFDKTKAYLYVYADAATSDPIEYALNFSEWSADLDVTGNHMSVGVGRCRALDRILVAARVEKDASADAKTGAFEFDIKTGARTRVALAADQVSDWAAGRWDVSCCDYDSLSMDWLYCTGSNGGQNNLFSVAVATLTTSSALVDASQPTNPTVASANGKRYVFSLYPSGSYLPGYREVTPPIALSAQTETPFASEMLIPGEVGFLAVISGRHGEDPSVAQVGGFGTSLISLDGVVQFDISNYDSDVEFAKNGDEILIYAGGETSAVSTLLKYDSAFGSTSAQHASVNISALPAMSASNIDGVDHAGFISCPGFYYTNGTGTDFQFNSAVGAANFGGLLWLSPAVPPIRSSMGTTPQVFTVDQPIGMLARHGYYEYESAANGTVLKSGDEILYTQGGVLSNETPPACDSLVSGNGRVWAGAIYANPNRVQVSKILQPNLGVSWSYFDSYFVNLPEKIVALGAMDSAVVAFGETAAFIINGDGPDDRGIGDAGVGQRVPVASRCVSKHTVTTEDGIFFVTVRGIEVLPRGFASPNFAGQAVEDVTRQYPECGGVLVFPHDSTVRWLFSNDERSVVIVLNQRIGAWSVLTYGNQRFYAMTRSENGNMILAGATVNDCRIEEPGATRDYLSDSRPIQVIETGWLRLGGLNGSIYARRLNLLGTYVGYAEVTISFAYDDKKTWSAKKKTWILSSADYSVGDDVCLELSIPVQKVKSIRFKIEVEGVLQGNGLTVFYDSEGEGPRLAARSKG